MGVGKGSKRLYLTPLSPHFLLASKGVCVCGTCLVKLFFDQLPSNDAAGEGGHIKVVLEERLQLTCARQCMGWLLSCERVVRVFCEGCSSPTFSLFLPSSAVCVGRLSAVTTAVSVLAAFISISISPHTESNRQQEAAGSRKQEAGSRKQEAGSRSLVLFGLLQ